MRYFGFLTVLLLILPLRGQAELTWERLTKLNEPADKLVILPTSETEKYRQFAEKIWPGVKQVTAPDYIAAGDQPAYSLIVLGLPGSNPLLARVGPTIPLKFQENTVLWVKWRHSVYPPCPMQIVTGPSDAAILNSGNHLDTPFDYLAIKDGEIAEQGYFHKISPAKPLDAVVVYDRAYWVGDRKQIKKNFAITDVLAPAEALPGKLKNRDAFVVGTPGNNRFLATILQQINIGVTASGITARNAHLGDNLILYAKVPPMYKNSNIRIIAGNNAAKMREFTFTDSERTLVDYDYAVINADTNTTLECGLYPDNDAKFETRPTPVTPKTLMLEDFDRLSDFLLNCLQNLYTNKEVFGIDIPAILKESREKITGNESPKEFMFLLSDMLSACKGDHLNISAGPNPEWKYIDRTNGTSEPWERDASYIFGNTSGSSKEVYDYYTKAFRDKWADVRNDYGPPLLFFNGDYYTKYDYVYDRVTYPRGLKLLSINSRSTREIQDSLQPKLHKWDWTSSKFYDEQFMAGLDLDRGDRMDLVFQDREGKEMSMPFVVRAPQRQRFPRYKTEVNHVTLFEDSGLLYIRLPQMRDHKPYVEKISKIDRTKVRAVVLDIRFNPGGGDPVWMNTLGALVGKPIRSRYQLIRRNTPLLAYYTSSPFTAVRVPYLGNEEFLVRNGGGFIVRPAKDSLNLNVPIYILTKDIFSAAGKMMLFARYSDQLVTLGERNPLVNHAVARPEHFYLPNSQLLVRVKVVGNIAGCTSAEDLLNAKPKVELRPSLDELLNYWNPDPSLSLEEQLTRHDPYFQKVLELTKPQSP